MRRLMAPSASVGLVLLALVAGAVAVEEAGNVGAPQLKPGVPTDSLQPSLYQPEALETNDQGRPVYPLLKPHPLYPNSVQYDNAGRVLYPNPELPKDSEDMSLLEVSASAAHTQKLRSLLQARVGVSAPVPVQKGVQKSASLQPQPPTDKVDFTMYQPEQLELSDQGAPVYPVIHKHALYPNGLQYDNMGHVIYPAPKFESDEASAPQESSTSSEASAAAPVNTVFLETAAAPAATAPKEQVKQFSGQTTGVPEYILTQESFGVSPYNNVDPFNPALKLRNMQDYLVAMRRRDLLTSAGFQQTPGMIPPPGAYLGFAELDSHVDHKVSRLMFSAASCTNCAFDN